MEKSGQEAKAIRIQPERTRFSDCCNQAIVKNRCPTCGKYFEQNEGRRELKIKALDGRTAQRGTNRMPLFKMQSTKKEQDDKMPKFLKQLEESGKTITGWTASDS